MFCLVDHSPVLSVASAVPCLFVMSEYASFVADDGELSEDLLEAVFDLGYVVCGFGSKFVTLV